LRNERYRYDFVVLAAHLAGGQHSELIAGKVSKISSVELGGCAKGVSAGGPHRHVSEDIPTFMVRLRSLLLP